MITFPNAKINLGLHVLAKRDDGFHEIDSCLFPVHSLSDILEILPSEKFSFRSSGLRIEGDTEENLIVKAYRLLEKPHELPPVSIHLHKVIPMGAGLGGGSSDGAFALKMLDELFELELTNIQLKGLASQLGSDCPFFIDNVPSIGSGTGIRLTPIELYLDEYEIRFSHHEIHVSTKEAYGLISPTARNFTIKSVIELGIEKWGGELVNDFESPISSLHPAIRDSVKSFKKDGAIYAAMSGSGSSVFGIFPK